MLNAIALDHELTTLMLISQFCSRIDFIRLKKEFTDSSKALKYINKFPVDLLFLAVHTPSLSGIKFSTCVPQSTMIVFMSAQKQFAVEGFNLGAVDYLLKPLNFERFYQAVKKAKDYFNFFHQNNSPRQKHLLIRADYSLVKVSVDEILYIQALDDYLKIHLQNRKTIVAKMTMKSMLEKLPSIEFVRVHRSFIIPASKIRKIRKRIITIGDSNIPVGLSYEKSLQKLLNSNLTTD